MRPVSRYQAAESSLLALRQGQRGAPTFGDAADQAFLAALASLPSDARSAALASGERLGANVYARYHENALPEGLALLAEGLHRSGVGELHLEDAFHRSARIHYMPSTMLATALPDVREAFLLGLLRGYLSSAYNCEASARALGDERLQVDLGAGRDVNRGDTRGRA